MSASQHTLKIGQYYYAPRGPYFRIYRCTHVSESGFSATPVSTEPAFRNREDARRRVYSLNGWTYTPRK